jgi:hypothetical protein
MAPELTLKISTTASSTVTTSTTLGVGSTTVPESSTTLATTTTTAALQSSRHQQSGTGLAYAGTWKTNSTKSASGGSFALTNSSGASVTIRFTGTQLAWIAKTSPVYGKAKVTLDGRSLGTVDLYSAITKWQQKVWGSGTLASGAHTVKIDWTGLKRAVATGTYIDIDAVDVTGTLG